ncbi:MAG: hypothetical protein KDE31_11400, partial [Caldilineaceae bacterium]|nr:hypothetical protein [Caldilineaceae bacterium]
PSSPSLPPPSTPMRLRINVTATAANSPTALPVAPVAPLPRQPATAHAQQPEVWAAEQPSQHWPTLPSSLDTVAASVESADGVEAPTPTLWPSLPPLLVQAAQPKAATTTAVAVQPAPQVDQLPAHVARNSTPPGQRRSATERSASPWPTLLDERMASPTDWRQTVRQQERRRRLDQEQQGQRWNE